jgi:EmrB/QacA subfamily drug resistance transporter
MVILLVVLSATFMQLLDISIVNTAIPSIQESLHTTYADVQLVLAGYALGFACTLITGARLGDIHGRRRVFLIGMVLFTAASALCGAAVNPPMLIGSRVLQGIGSGLMFPQVLSVIQVTFPPAERGRALSLFGATLGLGTITGPLAGGLLIQADLFGDAWRAIFYVNLPIGIAAVLGALTNLPESRAPAATRLDIPGAVLSALGLGLLVYPLSVGREKHWAGWIVALLVLSVPVLAVFGWYEGRRTRADRWPVLDTRLFGDRAFRVGAVLSMVFFAGIPAFFFVFTLYVQVGMGFTALGAGLTTFTFAIGSAVASARSDVVARRFGRYVLCVGALLMIIGQELLVVTVHWAGIRPHTYDFIPSMVVCGLGLGLFVAPVVNLILAAIPGQRAGAASGLLSTVQQAGGALGVAIIGVVFFGFLGHNAASSSAAEVPQVRAAAHAIGVSPQVLVEQFRACYARRVHSTDPRATPPGCAIPAAVPPAVARTLTDAGLLANRRNFEHTLQETLGYEVAIFAITFLLVLRLPHVDPRTALRPEPAPAA